ncbi:hypothetical protein D047_1283B, partial [Vibrio parahaemolyticus VPTS-2010_2]
IQFNGMGKIALLIQRPKMDHGVVVELLCFLIYCMVWLIEPVCVVSGAARQEETLMAVLQCNNVLAGDGLFCQKAQVNLYDDNTRDVEAIKNRCR